MVFNGDMSHDDVIVPLAKESTFFQISTNEPVRQKAYFIFCFPD